MMPWYKGFKGTIDDVGDGQRYLCQGEVGLIDDLNIEITELPVKVWTEKYKTGVLDVMLEGAGADAKKTSPQLIQEYRDNTSDTMVKFKVRLSEEQMRKAGAAGIHKHFKLQATINTTSMVLFDGDGILRKYDTVLDILRDFFTVRKLKYIDRKNFLEGMLKAQSSRLSNQARFILEKIEGKIKMENKKKKTIVEQLVVGKYDPDPVKAWKDEVRKRELADGADGGNEDMETETESQASGDEEEHKEDDKLKSRLSDFDYLVTMSLIKLSEEEKDKLLKERDTKLAELKCLQAKDWKDLWRADLEAFETALTELEAKEEEKMREAGTKLAQKATKTANAKGPNFL